MTQQLTLPTRAIVIISTIAVALMLLLASQVYAADSDGGDGQGTVGLVEYTVVSGDTLWDIATQHTTDDVRAMVRSISKRNGLTSSIIRPGQVLLIESQT
ncbi:MAG: LysM peptidoglycan-binding domain-containing protein [Acidobacteria bacterium]|nr:LysM peptidoglycan-binding domain-containing protein [Acidobacteriota bacterium]